MRSGLIVLVLTALICCCDRPSTPTATVSDDIGDVRVTFDQEKLFHRFEWNNTGKSPLRFERLSKSCSCAEATANRDVVAPGETLLIDVTIDLHGRCGPFSAVVTAMNGDDALLRAVLTCRIIRGVRASPMFVELRPPKNARESTAIVHVASDSGPVVVHSKPTWLEVTLEHEDSADSLWTGTFAVGAIGQAEKRESGRLLFSRRGDLEPTLAVVVLQHPAPRLQLCPEIALVPAGQSVRCSLRWSAEGPPLEWSEVRSEASGGVSVTPVSGSPSPGLTFDISLAKGAIADTIAFTARGAHVELPIVAVAEG